ncbi:MAG TPA: GtrA family protein, partial [Acidimicrobiales bacterium]|nr:GtrA family protein [Acidimicrobiales bacterium]
MPSTEPPVVRRALRQRVEELVRSPYFAKLWRYGTVSVVSTATTLVLLYLFFDVEHLSSRWSNVLATIIATVPSYYLNRNWAWGKSG